MARTIGLSLTLLAAAALAAGCAATPDAGDGAVASTYAHECRTLTLPGADGPQRVCGTANEWAQFDRRSGVLDSDVRCREQLRPNSNVIERICATDDAWAERERWEGYLAQQQVNRIQGSTYGGGY